MQKINLLCITCGKKIKKRDLKYRSCGSHEGSLQCLRCNRGNGIDN